MSEERRQRERTKGLGALTPPCPRLQAKKLQPLPTSQRKPSTGRRPPCKLWNVSKLVGSRGGRRWEECMEQGDDGGKRHGASLAAALWSCTKQVSQRRARVNKRHLTWEVPPCCKILALRRVLSTHNIRSGQSFVFQVEVEGCLVGW